MAFFDKLFQKKICDLCGGEIGLLGNRKLENGNMCKACAAKLSPWFNDRRSSTVEEIAQQLAYREANKEKVRAFSTTRALGQHVRVLLDENARTFMITSARDLDEANPDVLSFDDMTTCEMDIDERDDEIMDTDAEGKEVSYDPPRYKYYYDFYITIHVRNPYFDEISFKVNNGVVEVEPPAQPVDEGLPGAFPSDFDPKRDKEFLHYKKMTEEIYTALLSICQPDRVEKETAEPEVTRCRFCGAALPDGASFCERCGGRL